MDLAHSDAQCTRVTLAAQNNFLSVQESTLLTMHMTRFWVLYLKHLYTWVAKLLLMVTVRCLQSTLFIAGKCSHS